MRRKKLVASTVLVTLATLLGLGVVTIRRGFSARDNPSALEAAVARTMRSLAVPASMKNARDPFTATPELIAQQRAHFADHCALCHANNGSGETTIGKNMYPKPPDMRQAQTQNLTDGEIYGIIHHGIRLTGMPAWGDAVKDEESWKLVLFIRHLPELTPEEAKEMENYNPVSRREMEEEREAEEFLSGQEPQQKREPTKQQSKQHH
ncbi:MAG TPA: c-type cytochrome [Terriglobales bacterium]|nr:c-type cytochrome [Terriglobales bacterium]